MTHNLLNKAIDDKSLIGIRTKNLEWGQTIIGYIVELKEEEFTINEIDEYGSYIGKTVILINDILHLEYNDRYQKRLQFIFENNSTLDTNKSVTIWKEGQKLRPNLKILEETNKLCTFFLNEHDYVIGFLQDVTDTQMLIRNIGDEGDDDGLSCYYIEDFIGIRFDSLTEQKINLLHINKMLFC